MLRERLYQEIIGILILLVSVMMFLSLASYNIMDYDLLAVNSPVNNLIGPFGAWISSALRSVFGYSAYLLCVITGLTGWNMLRNGDVKGNLERIFAFFYLAVTSSALIAIIYATNVPQFSGGYIGVYIARLLMGLLKSTGAYLVIIIMNIIGLMLLGIFSLSAVFHEHHDSQRDTPGLWERLLKMIRQKRSNIPLNSIDTEIKKRKNGRLPWVTKQVVPLYDRDVVEAERITGETRLLPLQNPVYTGLDRGSDALFGDGGPVQYTSYRDSAGMSLWDYDGSGEGGTGLTGGTDLRENAGKDPSLEDMINGTIRSNRITAIETEEERNFGTTVEIAFQDAEDIDGASEHGGAVTAERKLVELPADDYDEDDDEPVKPVPSASPVEQCGQSTVFDTISLSGNYEVPTNYLTSSAPADIESWKNEVRRNSDLLVNTLRDFGIESRVVNVNRGPVITLYEMQIAPGIKVNRIVGLSDDIAMALAASRVRIVAPIPGKSAIGVEVPNLEREMVTLGDIIKAPEYRMTPGKLKVALGEDILGKPVMLDIKKLPHLLIAGATGSGKSVCVNSIITSLVYNYSPNYVRFIMVDPKMVELQLYNGLPHMLTPVITEPHVAPKALKWAMFEMERRYRLLSELNTRDIDRYNEKVEKHGDQYEKLPYIVIIMDELADLMMVAAKEIEGFITRIAQKARAVGIHLVLATQRPSVDVITGIIKANFPARIAFQVAQKTDSRTIIDQNGAEKLLGKGDMLYQSPMSSFPVRIQGAFISEDEVIDIVRHLRKMGRPAYIDIEENIFDDEDFDGENDENGDELFSEALKIVEETKKASASYLQRRLSIGYNRAARMIELMEDKGLIGPQQGSKPRDVYL
ncbi:MAG TPA: DNA translocase FtsK [Spirochaetota bacterium]|nr:DNA translocase FtsK [Spirochaetota bacterium]